MGLNTHLKSIEEAIEELISFHPRTVSPAEIPHQLIGTVIDNTVALLTAPANSIDGIPRIVAFTEEHNWLSLMKAIHRSFFSTLQLATEAGLKYLCENRGIEVRTRQKEKMLAKLVEIEEIITALGATAPNIAFFRKHFDSYRPAFNDYLESVLAATPITSKEKRVWRRFFRALSIVRNKASHSDTSLTEHEKNELKEGGCEALISEDGRLVMNPRMYAQATNLTLHFFEITYKTT